MKNRDKGYLAEGLAESYLIRRGHRILSRNWSCRWGELDLVTEKQGKLIFVEVKYRRTENYGEIHESLTFSKKKHLFRTINLFLMKERVNEDMFWQFDLICIKGTTGRFDIKHYKSLSLT